MTVSELIEKLKNIPDQNSTVTVVIMGNDVIDDREFPILKIRNNRFKKNVGILII